MTAAQDATPTVVDQQPGEIPTATTDPTVTPTVPVEAQPTDTAEVTPTGEPTGAVQTPAPTVAATEASHTPAPTELPDTAPQSPSVKAQDVAESGISIAIEQCGNNDRIGEFEFVPISFGLRADTSYDCEALGPSTPATVTLTPLFGGDPITQSTADTGSIPVFGPVEPGIYTVTITIGEHEATSANLELPESGFVLMPVFYFVAEGAPQEPSDDGFGTVDIYHIFCTDPERAGDVAFLGMAAQAKSAVSNCEFGEAGDVSFSIQNVDDPAQVLGPSDIDSAGEVHFTDVPAGNWKVIQNTANVPSEPFAVSDQATTGVRVITYVPAIVELYVEKIYCQDDARAGTTEFLLDSPPDVFGIAAASTCFAEPTNAERPDLTITIDNLDTGDSYRSVISSGGTWFGAITTGTYVATESGDGIGPITSDPFSLTETGQRLRIINYFSEEARPTPVPEGKGELFGTVLFCDDLDREGDVEFIISSESGPMRAAAVTTCELPFTPSGLMMLYPVDPGTFEVDVASGAVLPISFFGGFGTSDIPSGYYALGYVAPDTGNVTISRPFVIDALSAPYIEVNIFSAVIAAGSIEVYKDFCVDPARAGEAAFQVNAAEEDVPPLLTAQATATECRYSNDGDGEIDFTLTNIDTGRTWNETLVGDDWIAFHGVPSGTYTLAESRDGALHTSQPFAYEASLGSSSIYVRNFIAERDWEPGEEAEFAEVTVYGYACSDLSRNGGAEYFHYGPQAQGEPGLTLAAAAQGSSTAECREATEEDGLQFSLAPADGEGETIPFFYDGFGTYYLAAEGIPAGDYIVTEELTGVTTGVVRLAGSHYFDFLKYEQLPAASVTVNVSSANPAIADTLPAGATWTVSQNGVELFTNTFAAEHLQLPASIAVTNPVAYGTYDITVSAGPAFEAYAGTLIVDQPEEIVDIVLQPVPVEPSPTPVVETNDVIVTVTTVDGGEIPTGTQVCLTGEEYDVCWALDATAGRLIAAAAPSGTTVMFANVPLGAYELWVPANAPYQAFAQTIQVPESSPYEVTVVLLRQGDTPSPTAMPGTPTPAATATATPASTAVTALPVTGNGAAGDGTMATGLLAAASVAALLAAAGLAWSQRRQSSR
ncbi:MAG TPA: hypothetical protein VM450_12905 [Thermomicrobiales bacterium]|nr:hypothetical protein [Thermomicrobiales bacterium]